MSAKFNAAFWKWFGDSKVVNSDGSPMEVYHGGSTREVFSEFKPRKALRSRGFMGAQYEVDATTYFFSESKRMARLFAENRADHKGDAWIMGVYLSIQNPIDLSGDLRVSERALKAAGCGYWGEGDKTTLWKIFDRPNEVARLIAAGYDGAFLFETDAVVIFKQAKDPKAKAAWVAFHPEQIKSSVKNDGSWDEGDPDIRSNPRNAKINDLIAIVPSLKFRGVTNSMWEAIQDEGLDEEQSAPRKRDWLMADLPISASDSKLLAALSDNAVNEFNKFDVYLKRTYGLRFIDMIDYDSGIVRIVTRK